MSVHPQRAVAADTEAHEALILDQFTRQAAPFSTARTIADERALRLLVGFTQAGTRARVLDVACGGGLVVCAFAPQVREAVGIDMTPAMLERGRALGALRGLSNVRFDAGNCLALPYADGSFQAVVTRLSFHHVADPLAALREMVRVCAPGGSVLVADMFTSEDPWRAANFNAMERLRDPSHVRAMPVSELRALFAAAGLGVPRAACYELRDELTNLLARSFPNPGDEPLIWEMFERSADDGSLGICVERDATRLRYAYPMVLLRAGKPVGP